MKLFFQHLLPLVVQSLSSVWLCNPMKCSMPGFPILHYLLEFSQIHVHCVNDAIQTSLRLLPSSPPALNLSEHWVFSSELAHHIRWPKYWNLSFSIFPSNTLIFRTDSGISRNIQGWISLGWTSLIPLQSKGLSTVFSNTTVQKHQFFSTQLSLEPNFHIHTWLLEKR